MNGIPIHAIYTLLASHLTNVRTYAPNPHKFFLKFIRISENVSNYLNNMSMFWIRTYNRPRRTFFTWYLLLLIYVNDVHLFANVHTWMCVVYALYNVHNTRAQVPIRPVFRPLNFDGLESTTSLVRDNANPRKFSRFRN